MSIFRVGVQVECKNSSEYFKNREEFLGRVEWVCPSGVVESSRIMSRVEWWIRVVQLSRVVF